VTYEARAANPKDGTQFGNNLLPNSVRNRYRPILYLVSVDPFASARSSIHGTCPGSFSWWTCRDRMTSSMPWNESNRDYRHSTSGSVESAKPAQSALFATKMRQQRAIRQSLWDQPAFLLSGHQTARWQIEGHLGEKRTHARWWSSVPRVPPQQEI
jgi:hypothetical protein